ncbi:DUF3078 domain-containing protein [Mucilaginibacter sp. RS28]|uniref:DUF3078 domain-containing protein n=1 Tax=Mucilaginibacter straminoryzae TaxID=2932774 RepID=A0A9X1X906_9SPHI|nr:DUF3078 domain-containing protein [Mucilaginibacter straminoryzae]MCJ8210619.1 DUF3078 domain-containing protein [Mucilaginibacter straminoryzae]
MSKKAFYLLTLFLVLTAFSAHAQLRDSLRRADSIRRALVIRYADSLQRADSLRRMDSLSRLDTVKLDTVILNKYRRDVRRSPLPVIVRPIVVDPNLVPVSMLDYKVTYWRKWITMGFNLNQSAFSHNWANGGISSLALGGNFDYKTEYNKAPFNYTGELLLLYGKTSNEGHINRKTTDRIFFDNKVATQLSKNWYFFGSVSIESQFDKGYQYSDNGPPILISRFMAPGYITESVGVEYKPNKAFDLRIGTGTARQTLVLYNDLDRSITGNYGVDTTKRIRNELAFQLVALYDKDIMTNVHLNTRYAMLVPYGRSLMNIDHRLDVVLSAKVNKLVAVTITGTALYDKDSRAGIQGTEALALGVIYRFP